MVHNHNRMKCECPRCGYEWESKVPNPKECPRCKARLDYAPGPVGAPRIRLEKKEVKREMATKLPWATAAVIIIVAAIGAWTIWGQAPAAPPVTPPGPTWTLSSVIGLVENGSGIENIYLLKYGLGDLSKNLALQYPDNVYAIITSPTAQVGTLPYENAFRIVIGIRGNKPDIAYANVDNLNAHLLVENIVGTLKRAGAIISSIGRENATIKTVYASGDDYIYVNATHTNWDNLTLSAGGQFGYEAGAWLYR